MMIDRSDARSLRTGFLEHARAHPQDVALEVGGLTISYGDLARVARLWAGAMVTRCGGRLERVGVFAYRSPAAYAGVLGALCAGATYVPLNPTFPMERTRAMLQRAELDAIILDRTAAAQLPGLLEDVERVPLIVVTDAESAKAASTCRERVLTPDDLGQASQLEDLPATVPEDLAYLLFTSGTTGVPKGVGVTHGNALHFLDVMARRYEVTGTDRLSQTFDQTFDLSVFDMFMAWNSGARLCVPRPIDMLSPARFVKEHQLTIWFSVPSVPALMRKKNLLRPTSMPTLRWSLFCGEPLPRASAEDWQAAAPNSRLENLYGPTELTIACTAYRWDPATSAEHCVQDLVPIGRPLDGIAALLVDDALRPVPDGEPGELCVSGPQTVPGYWHDPAQTAARFVPIAISPNEERRFYRTGDRVRRGPDGNYAYLGRTDQQIKVLGFRVELGEIEAVLRSDPGVAQAAAFGWPIEDGRATGIVAFVTGGAVDGTVLKALAQERLPSYMVPEDIVVLGELPLNANGKIDRNALLMQLASGKEAPGGVAKPA